ncbi:DUF4270 family protein [Pontibacter oryzae]|uniref:DUF4270 family protein n=1 Tax=Pontibacter oryzae TaxID=2304593 RepID=A0A399S207_9BACT|nr:DUF4270 family protein [Pontibacter oryzae]RIJ36724.1 DUF4270 family protein [Pontibacter oryzae]
MLFSKSSFKNKFNYLLCCLGAILALSSCEDPNDLGLELVEDNVSGKFVDTLTINVSTVLLDSIYTSGTGSLLVGRYTTPNAGTLSASTFFQLGVGSTATIASDARYDSLKLIMPLSGGYYGDTINTVTLNVFELSSDLKLRDLPTVYPVERPLSYFFRSSALYNKSKVGVKPDPLTSYSFSPRPVSKDTLLIPMPNTLGQMWFDMRVAGDEQLSETSSFMTFFKGLNITSPEGTSVLNFATTGTLVRLYYSEPSTSGGNRVQKFIDFPLTNSSTQFNKFSSDFTGSSLDGIKHSKELAASVTNEVSMAQAGAGLMIKLDIPHLDKLKQQLKPEFINKAVLIVEPSRSFATTYPYPVPTAVTLYETGSNGIIYSPIPFDYDAQGNPITSSFIKSSETSTDGRYEFSITEHLIKRLRDERITNQPLYLAPSPSAFNTTASRLVVGAQNKNIKNVRLKVYYTTIQ